MDMCIARIWCLMLLFNSIHATDISSTNDTESKDRQPRVNGRIVKLYSGTRPEPFYCLQEGFQADPTNCAVFYRCVKAANNKFTVFKFQCGPGTVYDPDTEVCNFPRSTRRSECGGISLSLGDRNDENEIEGVLPELPTPLSTKPVYSVPYNEKTTDPVHPWTTSKPENFQSTTNPYSWMTASYQETTTKGTLFQSQPTMQERDACTKDGFMGDSENCRKFYRCVGNQRGGFLRYEFSCSETTVWDDDVQSCNHPWAVQRSRCGRSNFDGNIKTFSNNQTLSKTSMQQQLQISYGEKVKQTQTQINYGQAIQNQTQINYGDRNNKKSNSQVEQNQTQISYGSAVSQTQTQINYGNGVQTQLQIDHTKESSQAQEQTYHSTSKTPVTSANLQDETDQGYGSQSSTQENANKDNNSNECNNTGFMGDHNDCKKFYRCVDNGKGGYIKYDFSCGEGTVWDSNIEACNHAWAVRECGGVKPESSSQGVSQIKTTIKPSTQNYQTTSELTTIDDSEDTGYGNQNQNPGITSNNTTEQSNTVIASTTLGSSSSAETTCTSSGFKEDPNDCKKFYRCVDNGRGGYTKYEYNCGEGTVWDQDIEACNHPWAVKKCSSSNSDMTEMTSVHLTSTTVSLVQTTTLPTSGNVDSSYEQQPNESTNASTTKKPQNNESNECASNGFMGDNYDCKKFYRCVDNGNGGYTRYEFSCGEGTVWDPKLEACNHAWAVEKCGVDDSDTQKETTSSARPITSDDHSINSTQPSISPSQSTEQPKPTSKPSSKNDCSQEGFMGDKNDCKKFYRCVDNGRGGFIKYEFSCGEGTAWDIEINACNHPSADKGCDVTGSLNSESQVSTEPNRENDEQYTESTESVNSLETSTKESQTTISNQKPQASDDMCTSEGFYGNSKNCKKFYRCVDNGKGSYTKYEFTCGDGTIWDQEIQACNHEPSDSKCSRDSPTSSPPITTTESDNLTSFSTTEIQRPIQTQIPSTESSGTCASEGFYANPKNCNKFYRCVDNGKGGYTKYDFSCGEGTMWVQEIQACDHDTGESCASATTEAFNEDSPPNTSSDNVYTQQPDKQDDESQLESSDSSEKCTTEGFYPNKKDCKKFYRCVDNGNGGYTKYDFDCSEGTAWDSDIQSCNHISEVKRCQDQEQSGQSMQDEEVSQSPVSDSTSSGTTQSSTPGSTTESSKPSNTDTCDKEGYYGNSQDCTKFYRCVDNGKGGFTKYDFTCGEGTIWDQEITTCNHPQDVSNPSCQQIDNSNLSSSSTSSTTSSTASSLESSSSTTENSSSDCSQSSTKKPDNKDVNCTKAGYYPDPNDCKKFYRCVDWDGDGKRFSVYHFECGEGTIWDPALDTCNHENSVYPPRDCSGGTQSQGENIDKESSTTESTSTTESMQGSLTEQTTTQESTSEHTTQESLTQQTTTEQTSISEQTTTIEQTTSQQTTAQPTTTNEQTTTSEKTTTTEQMISQQTTTQIITTNEQITSQHTTNEETTTQQLTTQESTTQQHTTTDDYQQSTTKQTTHTDENSTEGTTTEDTTNEGVVTEGTTTEGTTEHSTTNQTEESETTESSTSTTNDGSTTEKEQESTTTESISESTTQNNTSSKECPKTNDDQNIFVCPTSFRRHPKYCNMFYQCTEDDDTHDIQIATFHCPNNTIYDENKTKCVDEKKADKKCDGELAQKRRLKRLDITYKEPIVVTNERLKCPAPGHYPFEQEECSPAFLKCQKTKAGRIRGFVYQCPQEYVYWAVSRRCEPKTSVRDCKKSHNDWKGRWEIPVERRNVAP